MKGKFDTIRGRGAVDPQVEHHRTDTITMRLFYTRCRVHQIVYSLPPFFVNLYTRLVITWILLPFTVVPPLRKYV